MCILTFLKNWTLPVAIAVGTVAYLTFDLVPALDRVGDAMGRMFGVLFPFSVFLTLFVTFAKVDFHKMRLTRWHAGVLVAQMLLVACVLGIIVVTRGSASQKILWEGVLTCIIGPSAAAAPVVASKLGGNLNTMTTFTLISSLTSAITIPLVFPVLESSIHVSFLGASLTILQRLAVVLVLPLMLGWVVRHYVRRLYAWIVAHPDVGFYCWSFSLAITTGITVKNMVHADVPLALLLFIMALSFLVCCVQFVVGRGIGRRCGETVNAGQALFQKNTALAIWVANMYLNPAASIGAGSYVLWQNIINSLELWQFRKRWPDVAEH